jgi:hypothetical protein
VELAKVGEYALDIVERMRALGMPRQLHPPPRVGPRLLRCRYV